MTPVTAIGGITTLIKETAKSLKDLTQSRSYNYLQLVVHSYNLSFATAGNFIFLLETS